MGSLFSRVLDALSGKTEKRILMLGLDAAGKTTILYRLQLGEDVRSIPTIGFNVETVQYKNICFTIWHYFKDNDALIFVIDSNDRDRLEEAKKELSQLLSEPQLSDSIVLVYANKADLPGAVPAADLVRVLEMDRLTGGHRPWFVQPSCATTGDGLVEGLDWLSHKLRTYSKPATAVGTSS